MTPTETARRRYCLAEAPAGDGSTFVCLEPAGHLPAGYPGIHRNLQGVTWRDGEGIPRRPDTSWRTRLAVAGLRLVIRALGGGK